MTHVGFSGTREGMTDTQKIEFKKWIRQLTPITFHHGDCVGADAEAHDIVWEMVQEGELKCRIVVHPPIEEVKRAFKGIEDLHVEVRAPASYSGRNHSIVRESTVLIACPKESHEMIRGGTWSTIRYARLKRIPVQILEP